VITVLETGPLNTVQDLGRFGLRNMGVGSSGMMDMLALQVANILMDNEDGAAGIEIQTYPCVLRFDVDTRFVVTGADVGLSLDGVMVLPWVVAQVQAGQVLRIERPTVSARACLAVAEGINVPVVLGSRATQLRGGFGGLAGRVLQTGDMLPIAPSDGPAGFGAVPPLRVLAAPGETRPKSVTVRAIPATDHDHFTASSREHFWGRPWRITPQADRIGYRLRGEPLRLIEPKELRSYGIVPGIVQVPPAGEPIVQMADANTAGGYPRMACVIEADLWRLAQAPIGTDIYFQLCSHAQGVAADVEMRRYLNTLRSMVGYYRASAARQSGQRKHSA